MTSATMKRLWADPEWKERQLERIAEGAAQGQLEGRYPGVKIAGGTKIGRQVQIAIRVDPEVFEALKQTAAKQNKPVAEIIRAYIDWGQEQEKL